MKFPRHSRLLRSPFDMAPFAAVLFLLVIFLMLGALLPTSGLPLRLPVADDCPAPTNRRSPWPWMPMDGFISPTKLSLKTN